MGNRTAGSSLPAIIVDEPPILISERHESLLRRNLTLLSRYNQAKDEEACVFVPKEMTAEEFLALAEQYPDKRFDFVDGEIVEVSPKPVHGKKQARAASSWRLNAFLRLKTRTHRA